MFVALSAFLVVGAVCYGVGRVLMSNHREGDQVFAAGRRRPLIFGSLTHSLAAAIPFAAVARQNIIKDLRRAGYYHRSAFEEFAALRNIIVLGAAAVFVCAFAFAIPPGSPWVAKLFLLAIVVLIVLYSVPRLILRSQASGRLDRIQYALPDALDMITMCMTGGLPLQQAFSRVGSQLEETHPDLACELRIVARQMEAGSLDAALLQFGERIDTPDVQSLVATVSVADRQGVNVASAFQDYADGVRTARRQRAEEVGNKASVKMLLPLIFCLAPPVFILLLAPAAIELRTFVMRENGPGGLLSPTTLTATEEFASADSRDRSSER